MHLGRYHLASQTYFKMKSAGSCFTMLIIALSFVCFDLSSLSCFVLQDSCATQVVGVRVEMKIAQSVNG